MPDHYQPASWASPTNNLITLTTYRYFDRQRLGDILSKIVFCQQIHSDRVIQVSHELTGRPRADAMITNQANLGLAILTADCVPVFIHDQKRSIIGIAHAGWRGTIAHIASKTLLKMKKTFGTVSSDCQAHFGPSIQKCCYQVSNHLADQFVETFGESIRVNKNFLDLPTANKVQLQRQGMLNKAISMATDCTACSPELFYSYRSESTDGRMISLIALRAT